MPLWVLCGVAGSGKTTQGRGLARALGVGFLDADDFHPEANIAKMRSGSPLGESDRWAWLEALAAGLGALKGAPAVLAFPGLKRSHRAEVARVRPDARFALLEAPPGLIGERLRLRGGFFPPELAASQFRDLEPWDEGPRFDAGLPSGEVAALLRAWAGAG